MFLSFLFFLLPRNEGTSATIIGVWCYVLFASFWFSFGVLLGCLGILLLECITRTMNFTNLKHASCDSSNIHCKGLEQSVVFVSSTLCQRPRVGHWRECWWAWDPHQILRNFHFPLHAKDSLELTFFEMFRLKGAQLHQGPFISLPALLKLVWLCGYRIYIYALGEGKKQVIVKKKGQKA